MNNSRIKKIIEWLAPYAEVILYLVFGVLTTVVSIGSYAVLTEGMKLSVLVANVISWILAVTFAYFTNRTWVFRQKPEGLTQTLQQMAGFYGGRVATLLVEELILWIFIERLHWNNMLVKAGAQILIIVLNYIISKLFVFRKKREETK